MNSKEKLIEYAEYKGYSIYKIEKIIGVSNGSLKSGKDFGVDKLLKIRDNCPDLNMDWLIFNEGEMILTSKKSNISDKPNEITNVSLQIQINNIYSKLSEIDCFMQAVRLKVEVEEEFEKILSNSKKEQKEQKEA